tara:strand:- start:2333 stop:2950 length:618 start_codon:yes stop_codon:yes gene_type:complete
MLKEYQYQGISNLYMNNYYQNLLPQSLTDNLYDITQSKNFDWYYNPATVYFDFETKNKNIKDSFQFTHIFADYENSKNIESKYLKDCMYLIPHFSKILNINFKSIFRIKSNMLTNKSETTKEDYHPPHFDQEHNYMSILYYVHDSDGDTILFNKSYPDIPVELKQVDRFTPTKGSFVAFKSNQYHSSCNPIVSDKRTVINFVMEI